MAQIDYEKKYEEAKEGNFPAYKAGLYVCEIIDGVDNPDSPFGAQVAFHLKPLKSATSDAPMMGTDEKERPADYEDNDGNPRERYFFYNIGVDEDGCPASVHEKSNFGKLLKALFEGELPPKGFETFPETFIGQKVICQVDAVKKEGGGMNNKIISLTTFPENVTVKAPVKAAAAPKTPVAAKAALPTDPIAKAPAKTAVELADEAAAILDGVGQDKVNPEDLPF